ncbi:CAP domain-containing protein [Halalkalibacter krulwichiae]|uniref:Cysteine-rich secretory protein family protein n=1 Tax=Halalkalibacter krulwichiae TaxID=199441 RepID=A0A1X9MEB6_9BACI|nr:CAP domain-containing protein [Halalkalibacter krulwichiae]ARK30880.1 Cysteine-rich secretory protein family protein [Halalkalibacter krulwichiae]
MKKLVVTAFLVSSLVAVNFSGQVEASEKIQVKTFHVSDFDQEKVEKWYNELFQSYVNQFNELKNKQGEVVVEEAESEAGSTSQIEKPVTDEEQQTDVTQEEQQMIDLVNQERVEQGLSPLEVNEQLTEVARVKAQDMIDNQYFSHQSPTYGSPFDMLTQFNVSYRTAGENLAGNQTVEAAHQALMNSDGHRANILSSEFGEVGIGIVEGGPYGKMFVQLFKD